MLIRSFQQRPRYWFSVRNRHNIWLSRTDKLKQADKQELSRAHVPDESRRLQRRARRGARSELNDENRLNVASTATRIESSMTHDSDEEAVIAVNRFV